MLQHHPYHAHWREAKLKTCLGIPALRHFLCQHVYRCCPRARIAREDDYLFPAPGCPLGVRSADILVARRSALDALKDSRKTREELVPQLHNFNPSWSLGSIYVSISR